MGSWLSPDQNHGRRQELEQKMLIKLLREETKASSIKAAHTESEYGSLASAKSL